MNDAEQMSALTTVDRRLKKSELPGIHPSCTAYGIMVVHLRNGYDSSNLCPSSDSGRCNSLSILLYVLINANRVGI